VDLTESLASQSSLDEPDDGIILLGDSEEGVLVGQPVLELCGLEFDLEELLDLVRTQRV